MDVLISRTMEPQPACFASLHTLHTGQGTQPAAASYAAQFSFFVFHSEQPISTWKWLSGRRLTVAEQLTRTFRLYRLGVEAELAGKWDRADHFWDLTFEQAEGLLQNDSAWQTLVVNLDDQLCADVRHQPENFRRRFIEEIFIDTHCAIYNGYIKQGAAHRADSRAFVHWEQIVKWLELADLPVPEVQRLLEPAALKWIGLCEQEKKWALGLRICQQALKFLPGQRSFYERHARLIFLEVLPQPKRTQSAKSLETAITKLEDLRHEMADLLIVYVYIANLYHQLAITLANAGQLAEAIVAVQKALVYYPPLQEAQETRESLTKMMQELQLQTARIQQQLKDNPRAQLTAQGLLLIKQALQGFTPLEGFINSEQPGRISKDYLQAQAREIWRKIGLPESEIFTDEMYTELLYGMSDVMNAKPGSSYEIVKAWQNVVAQRPQLAELGSAQICAYIERGIKQDEKTIGDDVDIPLITQPLNPPLIDMGLVKRRRGSEPLWLWLFSRHDKRLKLQACVAILLVFFAALFIVQQARVREARQTAYEALELAAQQENYLGVIEAAEDYFSNRPLSRDLRNSQVRQLYDEAFVRWFVTSKEATSAAARSHIEFYEKHTQGANYVGDQ